MRSLILSAVVSGVCFSSALWEIVLGMHGYAWFSFLFGAICIGRVYSLTEELNDK